MYSTREMYRLQQQLMEKIASFFNATDVVYNDVSLRERFQMAANETYFQKFLLALSQNLPAFQLRR